MTFPTTVLNLSLTHPTLLLCLAQLFDIVLTPMVMVFSVRKKSRLLSM